MKVGDKVVCVFMGHEQPIISGMPVPTYNEIYTIQSFPDIYPEYLTLFEYGDEYGFLKKYFRPIDYSVGEQVAEYITEECEKLTKPELV